MDDRADDAPPEASSETVTRDPDDATRGLVSEDAARLSGSEDRTDPSSSEDGIRDTVPDSEEETRDTGSDSEDGTDASALEDAASGNSVAHDPSTPVRTVQAAAIEHAFAVGPPAPGLRLAGQLAVLDDEDPGLATLAPLVTALVGRDAGRAASPPDRAPAGPSLPGPGDAAPADGLTDEGPNDDPAGIDGSDLTPPDPDSTDTARERDPDPLVRGAAIAVARHDVSLARAADAADRPLDRISRAARVRRPSDDHTSL